MPLLKDYSSLHYLISRVPCQSPEFIVLKYQTIKIKQKMYYHIIKIKLLKESLKSIQIINDKSEAKSRDKAKINEARAKKNYQQLYKNQGVPRRQQKKKKKGSNDRKRLACEHPPKRSG